MRLIYRNRTKAPRRLRYAAARIADGLVSFLTCGFFASEFVLEHVCRESYREIQKLKKEYDRGV